MTATATRTAPVESARSSAQHAFGALLLRDIRVLFKEKWIFIGRTIMQPLLLIFVFTYVFPKIGQGIGTDPSAFSTLLVGGTIASAMIFQGVQAVALPLVQDFGYTREIEDRVLAPLSVSALAFEKVVAGAVQAIIAGLVVFPLAFLIQATTVHLSIRPIYLVTLFPLGALMSAALGLTVGTRVEPRQVPLVFSLLVIPMTFLGCVYYPWATLQNIAWLKWAIVINPLVYLSEGLRLSMAKGVPHMPVLAIYAAIIGFTLLLLRWGIEGFRRRVLT